MTNTHDLQGASAAPPTAQLQVDAHYQELARQHQSLDARLHALAALAHLTDAQHLEQLTLKKKKLAIKDRIAALAAGQPR